jgi:hypothetical protein
VTHPQCLQVALGFLQQAHQAPTLREQLVTVVAQRSALEPKSGTPDDQVVTAIVTVVGQRHL